MVTIPYVSLVPGGQQMPQIPVMQATRGQTAQAMGNVSSALNSQSEQAQSLMNHYLSQAQQPPPPQQQAQQLPTTNLVLAGQTVSGIGGRQMQLDPTSLSISMPQLPQSSGMPSWLTSLW